MEWMGNSLKIHWQFFFLKKGDRYNKLLIVIKFVKKKKIFVHENILNNSKWKKILVVIYLAALGLSWGMKPSHPVVCGISVPWLGIELACPVLEGGLSTNGPPRSPPKQKQFLKKTKLWLF